MRHMISLVQRGKDTPSAGATGNFLLRSHANSQFWEDQICDSVHGVCERLRGHVLTSATVPPRGIVPLPGIALCILVELPANAQVPSISPPAANLKSLSLEQLGDIEVTTQSKEPTEVWNTPAAIYVLTQDDMRRSGATTLPDLLRTVPGVE